SKTSSNPDRVFFGCPNWTSKSKRGCGYFKWCDEVPLADNENIDTPALRDASKIEDLLLDNAHLRHENTELKRRLLRL
ncbi:hypothetical protein LINPERPRIM_LOCUS5159, partial [Linum perenne]